MYPIPSSNAIVESVGGGHPFNGTLLYLRVSLPFKLALGALKSYPVGWFMIFYKSLMI
jgi:hypothetical protein